MADVCMKCGSKEVHRRGLCRDCCKHFMYIYGYSCPNGHTFFVVLKRARQCPVCGTALIRKIGEVE